MDEKRLAEIAQNAEKHGTAACCGHGTEVMETIPELIAEVRRLRAADRENLTRYHEQAERGLIDG